jgi:hypothetical protein
MKTLKVGVEKGLTTKIDGERLDCRSLISDGYKEHGGK